MKIRRTLAAALCLLTTGACADEAADRVEVVRRAREMIDSTFKGDFVGVLKFTHPAISKISGGEEPLKKAITGVAAKMKELKLEFVSMDVQPPEMFYGKDGKTFALVKTKTMMIIPGKTRITEGGTMIAVRETPEGAWTFLRVNAKLAADRAMLKRLLPDFPDEAVLEAPGRPLTEQLGK
ncbi:MAG: hypothetical protein ABMA13_14470 [Chthoniobacteraceae bacterium]